VVDILDDFIATTGRDADLTNQNLIRTLAAPTGGRQDERFRV
jgi:hypothetical protein